MTELEMFLEAMGELQEEHEYTHPQVGREIGKLPSKLQRWACALWCLSLAIAMVINDEDLKKEVGSSVGTRWYHQAELLIGYFVGTKTALRTPAAKPDAVNTGAVANTRAAKSSTNGVSSRASGPPMAATSLPAQGTDDSLQSVLPAWPITMTPAPPAALKSPGAHVEGKEPKKLVSMDEAPTLMVGLGEDGARVQANDAVPDRIVLSKILLK